MRGSPTTIGQTFGAGDRDVDAGAVEDEFQAARAVFTVAGAERQNANGCFLALEFVDAADSGAFRQGCS